MLLGYISVLFVYNISIIYLCSLATNTGCRYVLHLSVGTILRILTVLSGNVGLVLNLQLGYKKNRRMQYNHVFVMIYLTMYM